jgi:hypothetical protein
MAEQFDKANAIISWMKNSNICFDVYETVDGTHKRIYVRGGKEPVAFILSGVGWGAAHSELSDQEIEISIEMSQDANGNGYSEFTGHAYCKVNLANPDCFHVMSEVIHKGLDAPIKWESGRDKEP